MSHHMALTTEERTEAAAFWADYFRRGGVGDQPSAFLLDAINDQELRDHLMFWQIDADVNAYNPKLRERMDQVSLQEQLGEAPDYRSVMRAITTLIAENNQRGVELDDMDTGSVFILMHVMWLLLGGDYLTAMDEVGKLVLIHTQYKEIHPDSPLPHLDPLEGLGYAASMLFMHEKSGYDRNKLLSMSAEMFGLAEDHPNVTAARNYSKGTALLSQLRKLDANTD